ncbi:CLUMA_CG012990, isoform A [Clunio marinus]|uniref:CLUMA_CG012990, isoform A n=1 Tax=Clunio marinus TaxID=568069 RepID=A0A1J1IHN1_9DIPT|nr:CLUMA_CG012990, isoform A [Clunio marinus]
MTIQKGVSEDAKKDPVQNAMGELGRFQIGVCALICLLKFPVAWHQMGIIFLAPKTEFHCKDPSISKCSESCVEREFNKSIFTNTIQMEFDLVCDRQSLTSLSQTIFMFGILIGNIVFGALADNFGRRVPLLIAVTVQLISGVLTSFATNYWFFVACRFVTAAATGGTMVTSFVLVMEIIGTKWRELFSVLYQVPFNLGHITLPLFAYYIRDWHRLQFALSIPSVILLSFYCLVPESPRWYFTMGKVDKSVKVLEKAAKYNKLPTDNIKGNLETIHRSKSESEQKANGNFLDLFRSKSMRLKTICMNFNWFVCGLCLFGVSQYVGESGGNIFLNVALSACFSLPGTVICIILLKYWGRKKTLITSNFLVGISMLALTFTDPNNTNVTVTLTTIALTGLYISFPTVYLYGGEIYPTVIRNVGIGLASVCSRIGSMIAPFVATNLAEVYPLLPPVIFGIVPIIGGCLVFFLPETRGFPLPETIEDGKMLGKKVTRKEKKDLNIEPDVIFSKNNV